MKQTEAKWNELEGADILSVLLGLLRISRQKARRWARATQLSKADLSLRAGSRLGFMREMRDASGEAATAWGEVGGAGRRESLLLLL